MSRPAADVRRTQFFFCALGRFGILGAVPANVFCRKISFSNTHAPAISDDSCLFEVRQCATDVRGQADIFDGFCVSLGRPMSKIGPRKRLSEVSAAVF